MPGVIHIEEGLFETYEALPGFFELDQCYGVKQCDRDMFCQFVFSVVLIQVSDLHALEVMKQALAGEQSFLQAVPVAELNEVGILESELESKRALGALCHVVSQLI